MEKVTGRAKLRGLSVNHQLITDMPKTEKAIKLKDDQGTIPDGADLRWHPQKSGLCYVMHAGRERPVRVTSAFKTPSMEELEDWNGDGVCETPTGFRTEPDGHGEDGSPSWLMVMGLV